jgi:hypothetical protein
MKLFNFLDFNQLDRILLLIFHKLNMDSYGMTKFLNKIIIIKKCILIRSRSNIDSNNSVIIDESFNYENICN